MHFNINLWCSVLQYCQLNQIGKIIILVWKRESPQINGVFIRGMQLVVNQVTVAGVLQSVTQTQERVLQSVTQTQERVETL